MATLKMNVNQVNSDFQSIKTAITDKGVAIDDGTKTSEYADKVSDVYEAGQKSMVDESKIIESTATGTGIVNIDDISEIPHDITVQLSSDTITDFSGVEVDVYGKNLISAYDVYSGWGSYNVCEVDGRECVKFKDNVATKITTIPFKEDTTYTVSMWAKSVVTSTANNNESQLFRFYYSDGTTEILTIGRNKDWQFYSKSSNPTKTVVAIGSNSYNYTLDLYVDVNTFQLEVSPTYSDYEPVDKRTFTANIDGTVDGIPYHSPNMTVVADSDIMVNYHKSYTKQLEYDRYWDVKQNYGNGMNCWGAFAGTGWTRDNFKPKYPIKFSTSSNYPFYNNRILEINVDIDCSLPNVFTQILYAPGYLRKVKKIILKADGSQTAIDPFKSCNDLTDIDFEGLIGCSVTFQWSPLTAKSAINVITHLKNYAGTDSEFANTLTLSSKTKTALEAEGATSPNGNTWAEYIKDIGWNLA